MRTITKDSQIYNYVRPLNTGCNTRCEIHMFAEKVRINFDTSGACPGGGGGDH